MYQHVLAWHEALATEGIELSVWRIHTCLRLNAPGRSALGVLSGGYGLEELERTGAYAVFADPADLLNHIDEVGGRH